MDPGVDLLNFFNPPDATLAEVDFDVTSEIPVDHIFQNFHEAFELGGARPAPGSVALDWCGCSFAHAKSLSFHFQDGPHPNNHLLHPKNKLENILKKIACLFLIMIFCCTGH